VFSLGIQKSYFLVFSHLSAEMSLETEILSQREGPVVIIDWQNVLVLVLVFKQAEVIK